MGGFKPCEETGGKRRGVVGIHATRPGRSKSKHKHRQTPNQIKGKKEVFNMSVCSGRKKGGPSIQEREREIGGSLSLEVRSIPGPFKAFKKGMCIFIPAP